MSVFRSFLLGMAILAVWETVPSNASKAQSFHPMGNFSCHLNSIIGTHGAVVRKQNRSLPPGVDLQELLLEIVSSDTAVGQPMRAFRTFNALQRKDDQLPGIIRTAFNKIPLQKVEKVDQFILKLTLKLKSLPTRLFLTPLKPGEPRVSI